VELGPGAPSDWALHCHKSQHTMNAMSHDLPNMIGTRPGAAEEKIRKVLPAYMTMGEAGMGGRMDMGRPKNTLPMMAGTGPFGGVEMGGMFTIVKVRDGITSYEDRGWRQHPAGTLARAGPSDDRAMRTRDPNGLSRRIRVVHAARVGDHRHRARPPAGGQDG
jgi:hypothetical protein